MNNISTQITFDVINLISGVDLNNIFDVISIPKSSRRFNRFLISAVQHIFCFFSSAFQPNQRGTRTMSESKEQEQEQDCIELLSTKVHQCNEFKREDNETKNTIDMILEYITSQISNDKSRRRRRENERRADEGHTKMIKRIFHSINAIVENIINLGKMTHHVLQQPTQSLSTSEYFLILEIFVGLLSITSKTEIQHDLINHLKTSNQSNQSNQTPPQNTLKSVTYHCTVAGCKYWKTLSCSPECEYNLEEHEWGNKEACDGYKEYSKFKDNYLATPKQLPYCPDHILLPAIFHHKYKNLMPAGVSMCMLKTLISDTRHREILRMTYKLWYTIFSSVIYNNQTIDSRHFYYYCEDGEWTSLLRTLFPGGLDLDSNDSEHGKNSLFSKATMQTIIKSVKTDRRVMNLIKDCVNVAKFRSDSLDDKFSVDRYDNGSVHMNWFEKSDDCSVDWYYYIDDGIIYYPYCYQTDETFHDVWYTWNKQSHFLNKQSELDMFPWFENGAWANLEYEKEAKKAIQKKNHEEKYVKANPRIGDEIFVYDKENGWCNGEITNIDFDSSISGLVDYVYWTGDGKEDDDKEEESLDLDRWRETNNGIKVIISDHNNVYRELKQNNLLQRYEMKLVTTNTKSYGDDQGVSFQYDCIPPCKSKGQFGFYFLDFAFKGRKLIGIRIRLPNEYPLHQSPQFEVEFMDDTIIDDTLNNVLLFLSWQLKEIYDLSNKPKLIITQWIEILHAEFVDITRKQAPVPTTSPPPQQQSAAEQGPQDATTATTTTSPPPQPIMNKKEILINPVLNTEALSIILKTWDIIVGNQNIETTKIKIRSPLEHLLYKEDDEEDDKKDHEDDEEDVKKDHEQDDEDDFDMVPDVPDEDDEDDVDMVPDQDDDVGMVPDEDDEDDKKDHEEDDDFDMLPDVPDVPDPGYVYKIRCHKDKDEDEDEDDDEVIKIRCYNVPMIEGIWIIRKADVDSIMKDVDDQDDDYVRDHIYDDDFYLDDDDVRANMLTRTKSVNRILQVLSSLHPEQLRLILTTTTSFCAQPLIQKQYKILIEEIVKQNPLAYYLQQHKNTPIFNGIKKIIEIMHYNPSVIHKSIHILNYWKKRKLHQQKLCKIQHQWITIEKLVRYFKWLYQDMREEEQQLINKVPLHRATFIMKNFGNNDNKTISFQQWVAYWEHMFREEAARCLDEIIIITKDNEPLTSIYQYIRVHQYKNVKSHIAWGFYLSNNLSFNSLERKDRVRLHSLTNTLDKDLQQAVMEHVVEKARNVNSDDVVQALSVLMSMINEK